MDSLTGFIRRHMKNEEVTNSGYPSLLHLLLVFQTWASHGGTIC